MDKLKKQAMGIVNQLFDLAEVPVNKRQEINDVADKYMYEQLALYGVVPSYYQVVQETRKLGLQEVTTGLKTLEQAKKAISHNVIV